MKVTFDQQSFLKDGERFFLNSGEMQYYRVSRDKWEEHLQKIKAAGLNTVCTYIPWDWHEEVEGQFDFTGETHPQKDLRAWLKLCEQYELMVILKPGPVILAEYRGAGIPFWFIDKYSDECRVKDSDGNIAQSDAMTFMDETYLKYARRWYDQIIPLITEHQVSNGGPVTMLQVCNEVGVFTWLAHQADYSPVCLEMYATFLEKKYADVTVLNDIYAENNASFADVVPPSDKDTVYASREAWAKDIDWHEYWRYYYAEYLRLLMNEMRGRGIDVPFYHNLPGWIYGSGWEFPLNITMYSDLYDDDYPEMIFGVDHIPEYMSYRNAHDDRVINDIVLAMQGGGPLFAAEFQSGSREYHVVPTPREMALFYKASLSHGLVGWNYYMFSQGQNSPGKGFSGKTFYWFTPLDVEAHESSVYPTVQETSALIDSLEPQILSSKRRAKIAVGFYAPYYATELEKDASQTGLRLQPSKVRKTAYFDGLLKALQLLNIDYDMVDLQRCSQEEMQSYEQLWVFSVEFMDGDSQAKIVTYMEHGGQAVIYPTMPEYGLNMKPCTILQDALGVTGSVWKDMDSPLINVGEREDIKCHNPIRIFSKESLGDAKPLSFMQGECCGWVKSLGSGSAVMLGATLSYEIEDHRVVYEDLLNLSGACLRQTDAAGERLLVQQRFADEGGLLFIGNYYNEDERAAVTYTHPDSGEKINWPYGVDDLQMPQTYGVLSPLCRSITNDLTLLHTTSDILSMDISDDRCEMSLKGDRDLLGELVFEGSAASQLKDIMVDGKTVVLEEKAGRCYAHYPHLHQEPIIVTVDFKSLG